LLPGCICSPGFISPPGVEPIIRMRARCAASESGSVSPGTLPGADATQIPVARKRAAITRVSRSPRGRSRIGTHRAGQAAQENSAVERPLFPSNSMPNALIRELVAWAIVRSDATG
jgi:hypothetical protein